MVVGHPRCPTGYEVEAGQSRSDGTGSKTRQQTGHDRRAQEKDAQEQEALRITGSYEGFYCPQSGRISFLRKNVQTNDTFQVFTGNLSMAGSKNFMGGVFAQESGAGLVGEYSFSAQK